MQMQFTKKYDLALYVFVKLCTQQNSLDSTITISEDPVEDIEGEKTMYYYESSVLRATVSDLGW